MPSEVASLAHCSPTFHHVGIAVHSIEAALPFFCGVLSMTPALPAYAPSLQPTVTPSQRVKVLLLWCGNTMVELVEPMPTAQGEEPAPVLKGLKERTETMYHFCIEIDHLEEALAELQQRHMCVMVAAPAAAPAFEDRRVAFVYSESTRNLIELLER